MNLGLSASSRISTLWLEGAAKKTTAGLKPHDQKKGRAELGPSPTGRYEAGKSYLDYRLRE
jgi:hypothetical protein